MEPNGGSKRRARAGRIAHGRPIVALAIALVLALTLSVAAVMAINNDNYFELGPAQAADILGDGLVANGPDWADLFGPTGNLTPTALSTYGGIAASFIADDLSQKGAVDKTTFSGAGGSNKNNDPIFGPGDTWHWDSGNVPPKDDLSNVYAYAVVPTSGPDAGHLIVYGGFERLDPNGDSHIDLEFLQDQVTLDEAPACNDPGADPTPCGFVGTTTIGRTIGDIIVSMDFVQGGGIGEVSIHEWDGSAYVLVEALAGEGCDAGDDLCAFNNGSVIDGGPWPNFDSHGDSITQLPQNAFTEFGLDVTELLGNSCITTFMGKTRSSSSFTAELKDFAGPSALNVCGDVTALKYHDLNADGDQDAGELGLSGWSIFIDKNGNELLDAATETAVVTDANGEAKFNDLQAGTYSFCEVLQANWINSDPTGSTLCKSVNVAMGASLTVKFGNYQNITKSGVKFDDRNGNGAKDAGEPILSGWTINAYTDTNGNGTLDASEYSAGAVSDVTDGTGYSFSLTPGKYIICEVLQAGWQQSMPSGNTICSAGAGLAAAGYAINMTSGQTDTNNDFGNHKAYKLIVVTCDTLDETLVDSTVTLNSVNTQTITGVPAGLAAKGVTQADLCGLGGASYDNLLGGTYAPSVELPDLAPLFP